MDRLTKALAFICGLVVVLVGPGALAATPKSGRSAAAAGKEQMPFSFADQASLLTEIGELVVGLVDEDEGDILLYIELRGKRVHGAIFHDRGDFVQYLELDQSLLKPIMALWRLPPTDKRWVAFRYIIKAPDFRFEAIYPGEIAANEDVNEHIDRARVEMFGSKPMRYPVSAQQSLNRNAGTGPRLTQSR